MNKILIGKIISTHGIKGEIKMKSNFSFKDKVFKPGNIFLIDDVEYVVKTYRVHKGFDMFRFEGYNDINDILFLMNKDVYINKDIITLDSNEILDEDLLYFTVIDSKGNKGSIEEIFYASETNKIIRIYIDREILIPLNSPMVKKIDKKNKLVYVDILKGM